jgi:hypothetical protein
MTTGTEDDGETTGADKAAEDAANALTGVAAHPFTGEPEQPARDEPDDEPDAPDAEPPGSSR